MRLIDADALEDVVTRLNGNGRGITRNDYKMIDSVIFEFQTIEERKTGRWYKPKEATKKSYLRICTVCQGVCYFCGEGNYRYCPNCGADMRGEQDG